MQPIHHAGLARRTTVRAALVLCASLVTRGVFAQAASTPPASPDSATHSTAQALPTTVITASRRAPTLAEEGLLGRVLRVDREHHEVVNLMAGNHKLAAYVNWQGKEITRLETKLNYLKTTVTDSLNRDIAVADSATASVHAQRLALEARLAELEARQVARQTAAPAVGASGVGSVGAGGQPK